MSARLLLEVAIRVMGLWFALDALVGLTTQVPNYLAMMWNFPIPNVGSSILAAGLTYGLQFALGAAAVYWAPSIAARLYPTVDESDELRVNIGPGDVYRTACCVLGVYLLVQALTPAGRLLIAGYNNNFVIWRSGVLTSDAVTVIVNAAIGMSLVFGSGWIGRWFSSLHYDPDTIPQQRFSIAALLAAVVLFAVCLEVIRWITQDGL